jgi:hypothetical protein
MLSPASECRSPISMVADAQESINASLEAGEFTRSVPNP